MLSLKLVCRRDNKAENVKGDRIEKRPSRPEITRVGYKAKLTDAVYVLRIFEVITLVFSN